MPTRRRSVRVALAALATLSILAGSSATSPGSAGAQERSTVPEHAVVVFVPTESRSNTFIYHHGKLSQLSVGPAQQAFTGQFDARPGGDVFYYRPGADTDGIVHVDHFSSTEVVASFRSMSVSGTYRPIVGDFDGNTIDDILWYAPGTATDSLWFFRADGTYFTKPVNISGTYRPIVIDANGDGRDDIIWYGPGTTPDSMWLFKAPTGTYTTKSLSIGGTYTPVVGEFGVAGEGQPRERLVFYNPSGADYFWTFNTAGSATSSLLPNIDGAYQLIPGQFIEEAYGTLYFYAPGSKVEHLWAFGPGPGGDVSPQEAPQVTGTYTPAWGDLDGNGYTDIAWTAGTSSVIWMFDFDGKDQTVVTGIGGSPLPRTPFLDSGV